MLLFGALAIAGFAYAVSQTMLIPAIPDIEQEFGATPSEVIMLMSAFWVSGAVTAGIFGRLGDMFGKRLVFVLLLALFGVGAFACAVAPTLLLMLVGRVLMGCGVGLFPLAFAVLRDELPAARVPSAIAILGGLIASGSVVGQSTGGLVVDYFGFRAIFWISVLLAAAASVTVLAFVPKSSTRTGGRVDVLGAVLLAVGLGAPLVAVAKAPEWGWADPTTLALIVFGAAVLAIFFRYERGRSDPLLDMETFLHPRIRLTNAAAFFVGAAFFGFSAILTQFFQEPASTGYGQGASATVAGLYLVPGMLLLILLSPVAGRLSSKAGPVFTYRLGIAISTVGIAGLTVSHSARWSVIVWPAVMYVGSAFTFGAMPTIVLQAAPAEQSGQSSAINQIVRTTGSAVGVQIAATIITASIAADGAPTDRGYTAAFALATGAGIVALVLATAIPRRLAPLPSRQVVAATGG